MNHYRRASDLGARRLLLLRRMQLVHYGKIEGQHVRNGIPLTQPPPKITSWARDRGTRVRSRNARCDFELKARHVDLFQRLDEVASGVVAIDVRDGVAARVHVVEGGNRG